MSPFEWNNMDKFKVMGKNNNASFLVGFHEYLNAKLQNEHNVKCWIKNTYNLFKKKNSKKGKAFFLIIITKQYAFIVEIRQ